MHALLDARSGALGDAQQLDAEPEVLGRLEVGERDQFDSLDADGFGVDLAYRRPET